ncbi:MAG: DUF4435 domain-containing protein [Desulfobacteraceae bacterium]
MSMIEIHQHALESANSVYHEFLGRYSRRTKCVYGFVEGRDDPSFYRGFIEYSIPPEWQVELWAAGNKDKVIQLHSEFDWDRFSKKQIVFFIDRDLSNYINEDIPNHANIFVTDGYSIENDIVNRTTCNRLLCEVFNLGVLTKEEIDPILDLFEEQLNYFANQLIPIMAWIVHWKRSGEKPCLNDIEMKHLFSLSQGKVTIQSNPKGKIIPDYLHGQCNIIYSNTINISLIEQELRDNENILQVIRGKYLLWFFVEFALSIYKEINIFSSVLEKPPKMHVAVSQSNGVIFTAPRARIPESLRLFLSSTHWQYIQDYENAA